MERQTGKEVAELLGNFINGANVEDKREFVETITMREHRTLQQLIFSLFIDTIFEWANNVEDNRFDLRNEYTVQTSKKIKDVVEFPGAPLI